MKFTTPLKIQIPERDTLHTLNEKSIKYESEPFLLDKKFYPRPEIIPSAPPAPYEMQRLQEKQKKQKEMRWR